MASLYRRNKIWWAKVQRDRTVHRRSLETDKKAVAEKRLRTWLDEFDRLRWGGRVRHPIDAVMKRFAAEHLPRLKRSSATRYLISLNWLGEALDGLALDEVTSARLAEFELSRRRAGVTAPTIRRDLACLSSLFSCAMEWELCDANPVPAYFRAARKRGLKEAPPHTRYLSKEEEAKLIAAADPALAATIIFAIETGLRREEQFGLTWDQLDVAAGEIRLTGKTKSGRPRRVPLSARAGTVLGTFPRHIRSPYVFRHADGRRYVALNKGLAGAARRAGIARLCWHDLRRTCGCRLLQERGLSMAQVALWLGHSSILVTEKTYAFLEYEHMRDAITGGRAAGELKP